MKKDIMDFVGDCYNEITKDDVYCGMIAYTEQSVRSRSTKKSVQLLCIITVWFFLWCV